MLVGPLGTGGCLQPGPRSAGSPAAGRGRRRPGAAWWSAHRGSGPAPRQGRRQPRPVPRQVRNRQPRCPLLPRSGDVLVGPDAGVVDVHLPLHRLPVAGAPARGQDPVPGAIGLPAAQPLMAGLPGPVALRDIPPRRSGGRLPAAPIDHLPGVSPSAVASPGRGSGLSIRAQASSVSSCRRITTRPGRQPRKSPGQDRAHERERVYR